jgi:hypothetical protein
VTIKKKGRFEREEGEGEANGSRRGKRRKLRQGKGGGEANGSRRA